VAQKWILIPCMRFVTESCCHDYSPKFIRIVSNKEAFWIELLRFYESYWQNNNNISYIYRPGHPNLDYSTTGIVWIGAPRSSVLRLGVQQRKFFTRIWTHSSVKTTIWHSRWDSMEYANYMVTTNGISRKRSQSIHLKSEKQCECKWRRPEKGLF